MQSLFARATQITPGRSAQLRRAAITFVVMAVAVLVTACGSAGDSDGISNRAATGNRAQFSFVAGTGVQTDQSRLISEAEGRLTAQCMERAGFRYYPGVGARQSPLYKSISLYSYSGDPPSERTDVAARRLYGYALFETYTAAGEMAENGGRAAVLDRQYVASLSARSKASYNRALYGDASASSSVTVDGIQTSYDPTGCIGHADAILYGSMRQAVTVQDVANAAFSRVSSLAAADQRVSRATKEWSVCLDRASGHEYSNTNAPIEHMQSLYALHGATQSLRRLEEKLSTEDGRCQFSSGLARAYSGAFAAGFRTLGRKRFAQIQAAIRTNSVAARRASRVLRLIRSTRLPPEQSVHGSESSRPAKPVVIGRP